MPSEQIDRKMRQEVLVSLAAAMSDTGAGVKGRTPAAFLADLAETLTPMLTWIEGEPSEGMPPPPPTGVEWQRMPFRSKTERRMAEALDRAGVAFMANARGRFGVTADHRETREPDFLVVDDGKLGILEVDGDQFHPPERAAEHHDRDRLFKDHGIRVVERYRATECWEDPDRVVTEFRRLLRLNG